MDLVIAAAQNSTPKSTLAATFIQGAIQLVFVNICMGALMVRGVKRINPLCLQDDESMAIPGKQAADVSTNWLIQDAHARRPSSPTSNPSCRTSHDWRHLDKQLA